MNINDIYRINENNRSRLSELTSAFEKNKVIPFVGGGMSMPLYDSWEGLLTKLLQMSCDNPKIISDFNNYLHTDYEKAAEIVYNNSESFIMKNINDIFDINHLSKKEIPLKLLYLAYTFDGPILTTNYDRCLERAYDLIKKPFIATYNISNIRKRDSIVNRALQSDSRKLFKLHGDYDDFDSIIFTEQQYKEAYEDESFKYIMEEFSKHKHILFLGCSLKGNDRYMKIIKEISLTGTYHYAFMQYPNNDDDYFEQNNTLAQHGIYAIWYPNGEHDESLECLFNYLYYSKNHEDIYITIDDIYSTNTNDHVKEYKNNTGDKDMKQYEHLDDIIESPNTMIYEEGNTLIILFENGDFSLKLPSEWKSHFVLYHNCICSKKAFKNKKHDGKIVSIISKSEFEDSWPFTLIGYSNNTYYYAVRVTDVRYDIDNEEEKNEYEKLSSSLWDILSSAECYSEKTNKMSRVFELPHEQFTGIILSNDTRNPKELIDCYSEDYILNRTERGIIHQVMPYWEIHAKQAVYSHGRTWYNCYNFNSKIDYGWIESNNIIFDSPQNHIPRRLLSDKPIVSANLEAKWATQEDLENAIKLDLLEETEKNVAFNIDKDITEFNIYSKNINNQLNLKNKLDNLKASQCLIVGLTFPGDFSEYEISFIDENGLRRRYVLSVSGRDGSILLS